MGNGARSAVAVAMLVTLTLLPGPAGAQDLKGRWSAGPPLARGWEEIVGAVVKGRISILTGYQAYPRGFSGRSNLIEWLPVGIVQVLDPAAGRWVDRARMPVPAHHVAAAVVDDKVYIFGGFVSPEGLGGWSSVANAWMYDPEADRWTPRTPMPTPRGGAHAAVVGGRVYVIGGFTSSSRIPGNIGRDTGANEEYDPRTDSWVVKQPMPTPRNHHAVGAIAGRIYVAGGRIGAPFTFASSHINVTEEYDPARNLWTRKALMPTPRSGMGYAVLDGKLFTFGGETATSVHAEVEAYDPVANRWLRATPMPVAKHAPAVAVLDGKVYLISGNVRVGGGSEVPTVDIFELEPPAARR